MKIKLNGTGVLGGFASQGYMRCAEATSKSSLHWVGLVQTASANQVLTIKKPQNEVLQVQLIYKQMKVPVFIEKLADANNLFSATATQLTTGDNWNAGGDVKIGHAETIDTQPFPPFHYLKCQSNRCGCGWRLLTFIQ